MRALLIRLGCLLSLLIASSGSAVTMAWAPIGDPGNACDPQSQGCFGAVGYAYNIGAYEVTNAQYVEFLNAKAAASDPYRLYTLSMSDSITQTVSSGSYSYSAIAGRENMPVNYISFWDAVRFANWMNNGQGSGETETGAYTLLGGTEEPSNYSSVTRNTGAIVFVPSEDEWYKAAYYHSATQSYSFYPASSPAANMTCAAPTATPNRANCANAAGGDRTPVGAYTSSPGPNDTFDQGGNVYEWNEAIIIDGYGTNRGQRGGAFNYGSISLGASARYWGKGAHEEDGFRLAMIPEPSTCLLLIAGLLGIAGWRRARD